MMNWNAAAVLYYFPLSRVEYLSFVKQLAVELQHQSLDALMELFVALSQLVLFLDPVHQESDEIQL